MAAKLSSTLGSPRDGVIDTGFSFAVGDIATHITLSFYVLFRHLRLQSLTA